MNGERFNDALEGIQKALERIEIADERNRLEFERNRAFNREMLARYDQLARDTERHWIDESRRGREVMSALVEQINQMREETRAQTKAIFQVLDRFNSGGGPSPATS